MRTLTENEIIPKTIEEQNYCKMCKEMMKIYNKIARREMYDLDLDFYEDISEKDREIIYTIKIFAEKHARIYGHINDEKYIIYVILNILKYKGIVHHVLMENMEYDMGLKISNEYCERIENVIDDIKEEDEKFLMSLKT